MTVKILNPGFLVTLQDGGRYSYQKFGVPVSGPMDEFAFRAANLLVGNPESETAFEAGPGEFSFQVERSTLVSICAPGGEIWIDRTRPALWTSCRVRPGQVVRYLPDPQKGVWAYVAIAGGIQAPAVLGSRSTYLRAGLGGVNGGPLKSGDELPLGKNPPVIDEIAGKYLDEDRRIAYSHSVKVGILPGPQEERFAPGTLEGLTGATYQVKANSDRMGYRLEGPVLNHIDGADIYSEGMRMGAIQVAADGQPMVMMADCGTTGGYTKIGYVARADQPLLAQCQPGSGSVQFTLETVENAQERYRSMYTQLRECVGRVDMYEYSQWAGAIQ
jgi:antagonist of KipI